MVVSVVVWRKEVAKVESALVLALSMEYFVERVLDREGGMLRMGTEDGGWVELPLQDNMILDFMALMLNPSRVASR